MSLSLPRPSKALQSPVHGPTIEFLRAQIRAEDSPRTPRKPQASFNQKALPRVSSMTARQLARVGLVLLVGAAYIDFPIIAVALKRIRSHEQTSAGATMDPFPAAAFLRRAPNAHHAGS
jgi:hypothetical protein